VASSQSPTEVICGVAVPVPGLGLLTYRLAGAVAPPSKGARVVVPLGSRTVVGCVVEPCAEIPAGATLRDVVTLVDAEPFLPGDVVDLALWVGEYYASGPGDVLLMAMPPASRTAEGDAFRRVTVARLAAPTVVDRPDDIRGQKAVALVSRLRDAPVGLTLPALAQEGFSASVVRRLASRGVIDLTEEIDERDPFATPEATPRGIAGQWASPAESVPAVERDLTDEQAAALRFLRDAADRHEYQTTLLHGVTGSGKTEIYLRLMRHVLEQGGRVLLLVPEIALTHAIVGQVRAAFGSRVAVQHSGLSQGERHDQWHRIRDGLVDVVVGTRSAVFAPIEHLALIVVDEEHDSSYKQDETPRYHGRDVAVVRGRMSKALVVLGSATPSLESATNAEAGRYARLTLTRRVLNRPLADVRIVDMRRELAAQGTQVALSAALIESIERRLERREQSLVLLNRRGFATVVFCRQCASTIECPHCSVTLTFHRAARRLRCHYCDYSTSLPRQCGQCGGEFLEHSGFGTERLEHDLRERFPAARIARVDRDTIRRRGAIARVLTDVASGAIDILVGTQMIAKGHDFPSVTLVGVVSADVGLGLADFRAGERTFQLLTQVVGRAGRGTKAGEAVIQTFYPTHYSIQAAAAQDYETFFGREIEYRRAMHYPPDVALINVVVRAKTPERALADAQALVTDVRARKLKVLGPAPAAMAKIKDEYRAQFFVKGRQRRAMREAVLAALDARPEIKKRTTVDVDPVSVM
jgi:primosomal protein N' (replication factor Y) (superfamily II helicase)